MGPRGGNRLRIVVLGYIVRGPLGGLAWHHLQYVKGLANLGHDVVFIEDSDDYPSCYDPTREVVDADPAYGLKFAQQAFRGIGLNDRWAFHDAHANTWHGPLASSFLNSSIEADVILNVSGVNPMRPWMMNIPNRVLIDTDPVFTQIKHLTDPTARCLAEQHTAFFTFGENYESNGASIPVDGLPWKPTRQPIVLNAWPVTPAPHDGRITTVMQWDSYATATYNGRHFGMKSASFAPFIDLPACVGTTMEMELAIGSVSAPRDELRAHGWHVRNPVSVTRDPWTYQQYIQDSRAEFTVAKHGYVVSRSGWFSERSAAYLASGRPVVTQETGFSDWLKVDRGLLSFSTPDDACAALSEVNDHYDLHVRAAREIVEEYFAAEKVLGNLIDGIC